MAEEGWYSDPYRLHEHRWFSDGTPTALVSDGRTTSQDPPPATPYLEEPTLIEPSPSIGADDLRRGGEAENGPVDPVDAIWSYVASRPTGF
jgi:hypothetical protein